MFFFSLILGFFFSLLQNWSDWIFGCVHSSRFADAVCGFSGDLFGAGRKRHVEVRAQTKSVCSHSVLFYKRLVQNLKANQIFSPSFVARISVAEGTLDKPLFGLSQQKFDELCEEVDAIGE